MNKFLLLTTLTCTVLAAENYWDNYVNVKKEGQGYRVFAETFVLFPRDSLPGLAETKRPSYHGIKNGIRLVDHYSELDDPTAHDYFTKDYIWNGSEFIVR